MSKQIKLFIVIIGLILIFYIPISYAIEGKNDIGATVNPEQNKLDFFTVDSREKEIGSTLNMYINLSQIEYDASKFTLEFSNININIDDIKNNMGIEIKNENNENYLIINKNELNTEQIILTYVISNNFKVGDKFTLTGKIAAYKEKNLETEIQKNTEENNKQENNQENLKENQQQNEESNIKEVQIEITIIEKQEEKKEDENKQDNINLKEKQNFNEENQTSKTNQVQSNISKSNASNFSNVQTVVYNGSRNNYLKTLSIEGYELNTEFSKENTTYFLTVPNDITTIKITATKEESSSTVCIYGNENLKVGTNKILISVTAENGDVRIYRIFVTREA